MCGPNMSYCAFENTGAAMDQVAEMLDVAVEEGEALQFSSPSEARAFDELYEKCRAMMELLERYQDIVEEVQALADENLDPEED